LKENNDEQKATRKPRRLRESGLLATESRKEYLRLRKEFYDEIKPCCAIERQYVHSITILIWEILRYIRIKAELINCALLEALKNLLEQALSSQGLSYSEREKAIKDLGARWFVDDTEVAALLARLGLDEGAIEAEAYRLRAKEIEGLDLTITSKEKSREDALHFIGKLRKKLGDRPELYRAPRGKRAAHRGCKVS
jgi:hypothetical protein